MYVPDADDQPPKAKHLRNLGRISIWDREKIIILIAVGVCLVDVSLLIEGTYLLQIMEDSSINMVISQVSYG